jgi:hypothetical protein
MILRLMAAADLASLVRTARLHRNILAALVLMVLTGCALNRTSVSATALRQRFAVDPLNHFVYRGSDHSYYYVDHAHFKTTHHYKVRREEIDIPADLASGSVLLLRHLQRPGNRGRS